MVIARIRARSASGAALLTVVALVLGTASVASAQRTEALPEELRGISLDAEPGAQVPIDRPFVDETGKKVVLSDYFDGEKPVIMTLGYYRCPMLCDLVLNGLADALKALSWEPGREFEIVTISFDPVETPMMAKLKKQSYVKYFGRTSAHRGWHFLVGEKDDSRAVADAVGFGYTWNQKQKQWIHPAAIFILTPDGKLSRCIPRTTFEPRAVKLSLVEASEGKLGSTIDSLLLWCFHYDEEANRYSLAATAVMRIGGFVVMIVLAAILLPVWLRSRKRKAAAN